MVAPGITYRTPFGFFIEARRDPLKYLASLARRFGGIARVHSWPYIVHMIFHPDFIKHVLQENHRNYWKGDLVGRIKPFIGEGLFTSEGEFWRRQRRIAQPSFHRERIARFAAIMSDAAGHMLDRWHAPVTTAEPIDVMTEMSALTLSIVGRTLFNIDLSAQAAHVGHAMLEALDFVNHSAMHLVAVPLAVPTQRNRRFLRARRDLACHAAPP